MSFADDVFDEDMDLYEGYYDLNDYDKLKEWSYPEKYVNWIKQFREEHKSWIEACGSSRGLCQGAAHDMAKEFPELRVARGYAVCTSYLVPETPDRNQHWWCVTEDNKVVDPTADQFKDLLGYDEYKVEKHGALPIGKCYNCGCYVYNNENGGLCSEQCSVDFAAHLNSEMF